MKNFPKHLNSKEDYEYIREHFPVEQWRPYWEGLLINRQEWFVTEKLSSKEAGVESSTHRIRTDTTKATEEGGKDTYTYYQEELRDNPAADFFRLHFTEDEVKAALLED